MSGLLLIVQHTHMHVHTCTHTILSAWPTQSDPLSWPKFNINEHPAWWFWSFSWFIPTRIQLAINTGLSRCVLPHREGSGTRYSRHYSLLCVFGNGQRECWSWWLWSHWRVRYWWDKSEGKVWKPHLCRWGTGICVFAVLWLCCSWMWALFIPLYFHPDTSVWHCRDSRTQKCNTDIHLVIVLRLNAVIIGRYEFNY